MNAFDIEKTKDGYTIKIKAGRGTFATAVLNGEITLEVSKDLAASISKALYTPKKISNGGSKPVAATTSTPRTDHPIDVIVSEVENPVKKAPAKRKPRQKKDI